MNIHGAVILAAGKGTRMYSQRPKVLQELLEIPMLQYVLEATHAVCTAKNTWTVIGHEAQMVQHSLPQHAQNMIIQKEQLGTGHALITAWETIKQAGISRLLVINGDTPLLSSTLLDDFLQKSIAYELAFTSLVLENPASFGRVLRKKGQVAAIIEAKDYDKTLHGAEPKEINAGVYSLSVAAIEPLLEKISTNNASKEYYITDLIALAVKEKMTVQGINCGSDPQLLGVNSPTELVAAEERLRQKIIQHWLAQGVLIRAQDSVRIGAQVRIAPGCELTGPCELYGQCHIESGVRIHSHCVLRDVSIAQGSTICSFSHLEQAIIGQQCSVGPYARMRPGSVLEEEAHIGNFVEMKKTRLGKGAKAGHLSYLGDANIGARTNIGAGTITCNYDGKNKHTTVIEEDVFIGSNTSLVAPLMIGKQALVGAGSVITEDVPAQTLALGRARQCIKEKKTKA